jgi:hypothetical protein
METSALKKFAQDARKELIEVVSTKVEYYLTTDSAEIRAKEAQINELKQEINKQGKEQLIEKVAYTWFNRFCALRFMDVNGYTPVGIISPAQGHTQPEMFLEAKEGQIRDDFGSDQARDEIVDLISGKIPSSNPQAEAYRKLLVLVCNYYNTLMPFLFEKLDHYTELLLPDDLLSEDSIIKKFKETINKENCQDVEIIGWLYQFYISEKKDEVFADLKKNKKVTPENIPAATQLFTPSWIVKYLVENSLGRIWMLNNPSSPLKSKMKYYINIKETETDFLEISSPEEIKICDPACGSGHMLTYAFDLLYLIYEEKGYAPSEIPTTILTKNLFGVEIDERAGELAAFALTMKARSKQRSFFRKNVRPNVCILENVKFEKQELQEYMNFVGTDLFTGSLRETLTQFDEVDNFGSLINPKLQNIEETLNLLEKKDVSGEMFHYLSHQKVLKVLRLTRYLNGNYHVSIANPPYMNRSNMNARLKGWTEKEYSLGKADLMTCFMERLKTLTLPMGFSAMINLPSWMFLSSFEKLRINLLEEQSILSLLHLGRGIFGSDFGTVAFILQNSKPDEESKGIYRRLFKKHVQVRKSEIIEKLFLDPEYGHYEVLQKDLFGIKGVPIAYWIEGRDLFERGTVGDLFESGGRNKTHNNEKYLRFNWEVSVNANKWTGYANGGGFRKYVGNDIHVVDWSTEARKEYESHGGLCNSKFWNKEGITWSLITSANSSFRIKNTAIQYSSGSPTIFNSEFFCDHYLLALLNSPITRYYLNAINPTLNTTVNDIMALPLINHEESERVIQNTRECISTSQNDWDSFELSPTFSSNSLVQTKEQGFIIDILTKMFNEQQLAVKNIQRLESENNQILLDIYGLNNVLTPEVPLKEVSLNCNPHYRYEASWSAEKVKSEYLRDSVKEFISYAVGCLFGRYSPDKKGIVIGSQGDKLSTYSKLFSSSGINVDSDNVIPILESDWFEDDIVSKFKHFVATTFGEGNLSANIEYIEKTIGKSLRKYFLKDFYIHHVKFFLKRPIYWLFSSSGGSFNVLIYLHRYSSDQVSIILNDYLREFKTKLEAKKGHLEGISNLSGSSKKKIVKAVKEMENLKKVIVELDDYERDVLYPLAAEKVEIDLDDGVKINYPKFGKALKDITGLSSKD